MLKHRSALEVGWAEASPQKDSHLGIKNAALVAAADAIDGLQKQLEEEKAKNATGTIRWLS